MRYSKIKIQFYVVFLILIGMGVGCGIEVGNPHDDDETLKQGQIQVSIADAPLDDAANIFLKIIGISLIVDDSTNLPLVHRDNGDVDILALQNGESEIIGDLQQIASGTYQGYLLHLNAEKPGYVVKKDGTNLPLYLPSQKLHTIAISESITINHDETTDVILHLDLRQSLMAHGDDTQMTLDPVITPIRKDKAGSIKGKLRIPRKGVICAYASSTSLDLSTKEQENNSLQKKLRKDQALNLSNKEHHYSRKPPKGRRPPRPTDSDSICPDAYSSSFIKEDGLFFLPFLEPGSYEIRGFFPGREILDHAEAIIVSPGEVTEIYDVVLE